MERADISSKNQTALPALMNGFVICHAILIIAFVGSPVTATLTSNAILHPGTEAKKNSSRVSTLELFSLLVMLLK